MAAVRSVLALGGNLGDRKATIRSAIRALKQTDGIKVLKKSPLVESFAVTASGVDKTRPNYLNGVVEIETELKPGALLDVVRGIERAHGRVRLERWGSRTLDIDIVTYGTEVKANKTLTLPHPRAHERLFVLRPWSEVEPEAILDGVPIRRLIEHLQVSTEAETTR